MTAIQTKPFVKNTKPFVFSRVFHFCNCIILILISSFLYLNNIPVIVDNNKNTKEVTSTHDRYETIGRRLNVYRYVLIGHRIVSFMCIVLLLCITYGSLIVSCFYLLNNPFGIVTVVNTYVITKGKTIR